VRGGVGGGPGGEPFPQAVVRLSAVLNDDGFGWSTSMAAAKARLTRSASIRVRY
jgi:hypothetical protein